MTPAKRKRKRCRHFYFNHTIDFKVNIWKRTGIYHNGEIVGINTWLALLKIQDNRCALCGRLDIFARLVADHDHKTGELRGALCGACNMCVNIYERKGHYNCKEADALIRQYLSNPPVPHLR